MKKTNQKKAKPEFKEIELTRSNAPAIMELSKIIGDRIRWMQKEAIGAN